MNGICVLLLLTVDASEAGAGNLEVIVRCAKNGQRIPNFLEAADRSGKFRIFFTPKKKCHQYKVDVTFNEDQVAGKYGYIKWFACISYVYPCIACCHREWMSLQIMPQFLPLLYT